MKPHLPAYDRSKLTPGIVHIGLGNFHRAHMAVYLDDLFALGDGHDWAILGAGVREGDAKMREALIAQDCLSTVIELDPKGRSASRIGSMIGFLPVEPDNAALIDAMSPPGNPHRQPDGHRGRLFHRPGDRRIRSHASRDRCRCRPPPPHRLWGDHRRPQGPPGRRNAPLHGDELRQPAGQRACDTGCRHRHWPA
jgi:hypothetical protein